METKPLISPSQFAGCDLRVGVILSAQSLHGARKPAYVLQVDFGALGTLKSTAQLAGDYTAEELVGRHIVAVVNFPPKQVGKHQSRCLVLGAVSEGHVTLLELNRNVAPGTPIA